MTLEIHTITLGPLANNSYILVEPQSGLAVIVDPTFGGQYILQEIQRAGWELSQIWLTHAHFDHTAGIEDIFRTGNSEIPVGIHPLDVELYRHGGGADQFGVSAPALPEPTLYFDHGQLLTIGEETVEVRHTPGHSPGHVLFYIPQVGAALVGDLIFKNGIGRTDLPGGNMTKLLNSIYRQVLTLPPDTRLLSGHGPETTVAIEADFNPYL